MLSLRLELLMGRYVASEFNNRNRPEWPPHPARVFSALVAAHYEGGQPDGGEEALRWLETLGSPRMTFSAAEPRRLKIHYVPVNDKALSDSVALQTAWSTLLAPDLPEKKRASAEAKLAKIYAKAGAESPKLGKHFRDDVKHVLPATRTKQPRTFPSVTPVDPVVWLSWDAVPSESLRTGLDALATRLVRVGHSSSLVAASWTDDAPEPTWIPDPQGTEVLRCVGPGQLDALDSFHDAAPFAEQRVMPYISARYRVASPVKPLGRSAFSPIFTVFRRVEGPRISLLAGEIVADAVRRALMSHARDPTPPLISGHAEGGTPLEGDHLAVVPLAVVGSDHARGDILGVALVRPEGCPVDDLYAAIGLWERATPNPGKSPRVILNMGRLGAWVLERSIDESPLYNLRESTWTRPSTRWASATPMLLDRHPGPLHAGSSARRSQAIARATASIRAACERIGLPAPVDIELSTSPFFTGSSDASRFRRRGGSRETRPLIHVRLTFASPIQGPVLLGAGRYRGLGLFRPLGRD